MRPAMSPSPVPSVAWVVLASFPRRMERFCAPGPPFQRAGPIPVAGTLVTARQLQLIPEATTLQPGASRSDGYAGDPYPTPASSAALRLHDIAVADRIVEERVLDIQHSHHRQSGRGERGSEGDAEQAEQRA